MDSIDIHVVSVLSFAIFNVIVAGNSETSNFVSICIELTYMLMFGV